MKSPPYLSLLHYPERGMVYSQWLRTVDSAEYRQSFLSICDLIRKSKANCWLIDLGKTTSPTISDQNWTTHLLANNLLESHIRKVAIVLPDDLFMELVAEKVIADFISLTKNKIQIARFANPEVAQQWLGSRSDLEGLFRYDEPLSA
jgi:hypothetical protein